MKKYSYFVICCIITIGIFLGVSWLLFSKKQPIYLPYLDKTGVHWSSFYTRYYMEKVPKSLEEFKKVNPWFSDSLKELSQADEYSVEHQTYDYVRDMSGANNVLDLEAGAGRALVMSGDLNGRFQCVVLRYRLESGGYEFVDSSALVVHGVAGAVVNDCRNNGNFSVERAGFVDFIYYDIFRCFSFCSTKEGIVFKDIISSSKKERLLNNLRAKLASDEKEYQSLDRRADEVEVEVKSVVASGSDCFLEFMYHNPLFVESKVAHFDCESEELVEMDGTGGVAYYFFVL
ncbi:hypothetical protein [Marinimicrobium locisalis]|uniref:hypothetical protein n=1 Tax=Marinimicrobium locisalis TaxID=546022 RepID=UPI0032222131